MGLEAFVLSSVFNKSPSPSPSIPSSTSQALPNPYELATSSAFKQQATVRGTLTAISKDSITIKVGDDTKVLTFKDPKVQRITSGTFGTSDAKIADAGMSNLAIGQDVMVLVSNATTVIAILILK